MSTLNLACYSLLITWPLVRALRWSLAQSSWRTATTPSAAGRPIAAATAALTRGQPGTTATTSGTHLRGNSRMVRLLLWCAAVPVTAAVDTFDRRRSVVIGLLIVLSAAVAAAALAIGLSVITTSARLPVLAIALLWGVAVLCVDRHTVSIYRHGNRTDRLRRWLVAFLLAAMVSVPISIALEDLVVYPLALAVWVGLTVALTAGDLLPVLRIRTAPKYSDGPLPDAHVPAFSDDRTGQLASQIGQVPYVDSLTERTPSAPVLPPPDPSTEVGTSTMESRAPLDEPASPWTANRPAPVAQPDLVAVTEPIPDRLPALLPPPGVIALLEEQQHIIAHTPDTAANLVWLNGVLGVSGSYLLGRTVNRIGRSSAMDVTIRVDTVSSHHCTIVIDDEQVLLAAAESTNKTFLNDKLIVVGESVAVRDGDEIGLGTKVRLKVFAPQTATPQELAMSLHSAGASAIGSRTKNEDRYLPGERVIALADGVGGLPSGEVAARLAVQAVQQARSVTDLLSAVRAVNAELLHVGANDPHRRGLASTLDAIVLSSDGPVHWVNGVHVGDGIAVLQRPRRRELIFLTRAHTLTTELMEASGDPTAVGIQAHPEGGRLMRALGLFDEVRADEWQERAEEGQRFLLASDGLIAALGEDGLRRAVDKLRFARPQDCANALIAQSLQHGAHDNVTVVVADVVGSPPAHQDETRAPGLGYMPAPTGHAYAAGVHSSRTLAASNRAPAANNAPFDR